MQRRFKNALQLLDGNSTDKIVCADTDNQLFCTKPSNVQTARRWTSKKPKASRARPRDNSGSDYFLAAFFLPATVLRRPLRVRELVRVR